MKKTFIIDGSNVIRTWLRVQNKLDFKKEDKCCAILLKSLLAFRKQRDCQIEVYFDGHKRPLQGSGELFVGFSRQKKADDLIVNSVYDIVHNYKGDVCVITQDNDLIRRCCQYGAEVMKVWDLFTCLKKMIVQYS